MRTKFLNATSSTMIDLLNEFGKVSNICKCIASFTFVWIDSKVVTSWNLLLLFKFLYNSIPLRVGRMCDLLLKIDYDKDDVMIMVHYVRLRLTNRLTLGTLSGWLWRGNVQIWKRAYRRDPLAWTRVSLHLIANEKMESSVSQPQGADFCQQPEWARRQIHHHSSLQMRTEPQLTPHLQLCRRHS